MKIGDRVRIRDTFSVFYGHFGIITGIRNPPTVAFKTYLVYMYNSTITFSCVEGKIELAEKQKEKKKMGFKIGDRVIYNAASGVILNAKATIFCRGGIWEWGIKLDEYNFNAHTCDCKIKNGFGRWADSDELVLDDAPITVTCDGKFKLGDRVMIRYWDDMKREFGLNPDGCIDMEPYGFAEQMKHLCGKTAVITEIDEDGEIGLDEWEGPYGVDVKDTVGWGFVSQMFVLVKAAPEKKKMTVAEMLGYCVKIVKEGV
jgi:hypothetical protein